MELYSKYNEIEPVMIALSKHKDCPDNIINEIIKDLEGKHNSLEILRSVLSRDDLTNLQISNLMATKKYDIERFFPKYHSSLDIEWKMPFSENVTNQIIKEAYKRYGRKMETTFLLYTNDREFIKNILE